MLKALSRTVEVDYNGPHYSLIDDTVLTPISQIDKVILYLSLNFEYYLFFICFVIQKRNLLSKASGIKAARFMIEKYPQGFMKDDCVPRISVINIFSSNLS